MNKYIFIVLAACALNTAVALTASAGGKEIFLEKKCNQCHRVTSAGIAPIKEKDTIIDLSGVGAKYDRDFFHKWLNKETKKPSIVESIKGKQVQHKRKKWDDSEQALNQLIDWLLTLTEK